MTGFTVMSPPGETVNEIDRSERISDSKNPLSRDLVGCDAISTIDVDDISEEVFRRLARYDQAELVQNPQARLIETAAEVAAERSTSSQNAASLAGNGSAEDGPSARLLESEEEIAKALLTLRPEQREMLKLQFLEGLTHLQIAQRFGVTDQVVKGALAESYLRLRQALVPTEAP